MRLNSIGDSLARSRSLRQATRKMTSQKHYSSMQRSSAGSVSRRNKSTKSTGLAALLEKLNKGTGSTNATQYYTLKQLKGYHTSIENSSENLQKHTKDLLADGEDSLFSAAANAEEGSTKEKQAVTDKVNEWVDEYNTMIYNMTKVGDTTNNMYLKQVKSYVSMNKVSLAAVGISIGSDGRLSVNEKKLENAALKDIKSLFGEKNCMAEKVADKAKYIESNATKNLSSIEDSSAESSYGYNSSGVLQEIYDILGKGYNSRG